MVVNAGHTTSSGADPSIIGVAVACVVLIGIARVWCLWYRCQRQTSGQQSAVQASIRVSRRLPPIPPPGPSSPSFLTAVLLLPMAATRAAPSTRRGSRSQPENVMAGVVYDPSLSEVRAWQQQPSTSDVQNDRQRTSVVEIAV